ncbi:MAG: hypothetical protein WCY05_03760, partial [Candidatus Omnitrophota bacterium]
WCNMLMGHLFWLYVSYLDVATIPERCPFVFSMMLHFGAECTIHFARNWKAEVQFLLIIDKKLKKVYP